MSDTTTIDQTTIVLSGVVSGTGGTAGVSGDVSPVSMSFSSYTGSTSQNGQGSTFITIIQPLAAYESGAGGAGQDGVYLTAGSTLVIQAAGTVEGGAGGAGGNGILLGTLNSYTTQTVQGYTWVYEGPRAIKVPVQYTIQTETSQQTWDLAGAGGNGGAAISIANGNVYNHGSVIGGQGGNGGNYSPSRPGGSGGDGVYLAGGTFSNYGVVTAGAGGFGRTGGVGVVLASGVLVNAGTIAGGAWNGDAVSFNGTGTLVADAGAVFNGAILADAGAGDVLELAGSSSAGATLSGAFVNFATVDFAPGAAWTLAENAGNVTTQGTIIGASPGLQSLGSIIGFAAGDAVVATGFVATSSTLLSGTGIVLSDANMAVTLDVSGSFGAGTLSVSTGGGNTTLSLEPPQVSIVSTAISQPIVLGAGGYADSVTITSTGTIAGFYGGDVVGVGTVVNYGLLAGVGIGGGGISLASGTIINSGEIYGAFDLDYGTFVNSGFMFGHGGINIKNGLVIDSGSIVSGDFPGITAKYGLTLVLEPGFHFDGAYVKSGNGTLIASTGLQNLSPEGFSGFSTIDISADLGITLQADHEWLSGIAWNKPTLAGFQPGDTIVVDSYTASYMSGEGIVVPTIDGTTATIALETPPPFGLAFTTLTIAKGIYEVEITAPCFTTGTRLRTPRGDVPVEALRLGDEVLTAFAGVQRIKWIGRRSYEGRFIAGNRAALPVCLKAGAIADNIPSRDLWVSPDHAICEGGVLVQAWRLVNGVSIVQADAVDRVDYLHIELDGHHVVFAEGCPTESFRNADCRARFANAQEYTGADAPVPSCLPLVESGFHLENIRRRLAARAGIAPHTAPPGPLQGCVDEAGPELLRGWAQDVSAPEAPVLLAVTADGQPLGLVLANAYRADLRVLGSGCHAFSLPLPPGVRRVDIHRAADGAKLAPLVRAA